MSVVISGTPSRPSAPTTPLRLLGLLALGGVLCVGCGDDTGTAPPPDPPEHTHPRRLIVQIQPGSMGAGAPFPVQPVIEIQDTIGNRVTSDNSTVVTATVASGNGTLQRQTSATASGGVVIYVDLGISGDPANYRLAFTGEGLVAQDLHDAVYLKNGSVIRETIIGQVPGESRLIEISEANHG